MQRLITSIFIVLFVGFAVFGLSFMAHQGNAGHDGCLAGGALGSACPQNIGAFSMIDLHFSALTNFSSATFSGLPDLGLLAFFGVLFATLLGFWGRLFFAASRLHQCDRGNSAFHRQLTGWLAVHNRKNPAPVCVFSF